MATNAGLVIFCWGDDNNDKETIKKLKTLGLHAVIYDRLDQYTTKEIKVSKTSLFLSLVSFFLYMCYIYCVIYQYSIFVLLLVLGSTTHIPLFDISTNVNSLDIVAMCVCHTHSTCDMHVYAITQTMCNCIHVSSRTF